MASTTTENKNQSNSHRGQKSGDLERRSSDRGGNPRESEEMRSSQRLKEQALTVGDDIQELAQTAGEAAREQLDPVEEYVRRQPLKSLLIAGAVGAIFGMLFRRS